MLDNERVLELIKDKDENDICDFKSIYYDEHKKHDLIKDIISFANCTTSILDKYIIFNIDDLTREIGHMDKSTLPDISEICSLLHEYIEPHLIIEFNGFLHQKKYIAYLKISANNLNKPYVIKKDFIRNGKNLLSQGQVYVRRNASNNKANRHDLDEIYESREKHEIKLHSNEIIAREITINNSKSLFYTLRFLISNNSKFNYLIKEASIKISSQTNAFTINAKYIEDEKNIFKTPPVDMETVPFSIPPNTTIQKTLYCSVSEELTNRIKKSLIGNHSYSIKILATFTSGKVIQTDSTPCAIQYT